MLTLAIFPGEQCFSPFFLVSMEDKSGDTNCISTKFKKKKILMLYLCFVTTAVSKLSLLVVFLSFFVN